MQTNRKQNQNTTDNSDEYPGFQHFTQSSGRYKQPITTLITDKSSHKPHLMRIPPGIYIKYTKMINIIDTYFPR